MPIGKNLSPNPIGHFTVRAVYFLVVVENRNQ